MSSEDVINVYETLSALTRQMLEAARGRDWDRLRQLEQDCAAQVARLQANPTLPRLTGELRARKVRILQRILADDREIRTITEPWMDQISLLLKGGARPSPQSRRTG
jgi:flagellar protein FliT